VPIASKSGSLNLIEPAWPEIGLHGNCITLWAGIATRCGLDGLWIESLWGGGRFSAPIQTGAEAHPAFYTMGTGSIPGVKLPGRGVDNTHI